MAAQFDLNKSSNGKFFFSLKAGNGQVIGQSQMYSSKKARDDGIASCKTNGPGAATDDQSAA